MGCPYTTWIEDYLEGRTDEPAARVFETHLDDCAECLERVSRARAGADGDADWLKLLRDPFTSQVFGVLKSVEGDGAAIGSSTSDASESLAANWTQDTPHAADLRETNSVAADRLRSMQGGGIPGVLSDGGLRYQIVRPLGSGGSGDVWEGWDQLLQRAVAIKLLRSAAPGLQETQRMLQEAAALGRLSHPHIVGVYEVQARGHQPALIMEYISGPTLAQALRGQPCSATTAARLTEMLSSAVTHAHDHGVIHRDLKPSNILLQPLPSAEPRVDSPRAVLEDYCPKIADFGLARLLDERSLTVSGQQLGTPSYMAPEQVAAVPGSSGPLLDVYGLGAVLYELLTGRPPFASSDPALTMAMILREDPVPPKRLVPSTPRDLETICLKCLAKVPGQRYQTVAALRADLTAFLEHRPISARPVSRLSRTLGWVRRNRLEAASLIGFAALLLTIVLGALSYAAVQKQAKAAAERAISAAEERDLERQSRQQELRKKFIDMMKLQVHYMDTLGAKGLTANPHAETLRSRAVAAGNEFCTEYLAIILQDIHSGYQPTEEEIGTGVLALHTIQAAGNSSRLREFLDQFEQCLPNLRCVIEEPYVGLEFKVRVTGIRAQYESREGRHAESGRAYEKMAAFIRQQVDVVASDSAAFLTRLDVLFGMRHNAYVEYRAANSRQEAMDVIRLLEECCELALAREPQNQNWMFRQLDCRHRRCDWLAPVEARELAADTLRRLNQVAWNSPGLNGAVEQFRERLGRVMGSEGVRE